MSSLITNASGNDLLRPETYARQGFAGCQARRPVIHCAILWEDLMSVKSDKWIRRMAREHGMIEPFEDRQVRKGVISYGLSSYGYDMRVAEEFRIFTNVNSTIVDPKHFEAKSFVEFRGAVCIVTLEISNPTPLPAKIYANEGLAQVVFFESDEQCEISYKDKKGKYQAQQGIVLPKI